jgi:hypothetical protein
MVSASLPAHGNESGVPASAPANQISANSFGLATSLEVSRASVVLAGSDFSTTADKYHGGWRFFSWLAGVAPARRRKAQTPRPASHFCATKELIYY